MEQKSLEQRVTALEKIIQDIMNRINSDEYESDIVTWGKLICALDHLK